MPGWDVQRGTQDVDKKYKYFLLSLTDVTRVSWWSNSSQDIKKFLSIRKNRGERQSEPTVTTNTETLVEI